jgi:predicted cobalt transporter CbtA
VPLTTGGATVRTLLVRGMLAGVAAGLAAFIFAYLFGESGVDGGIAFEEQGAHAHGEELVSRGVQSTLGLLVGVLVYAVAVGGILALVYAATRGRVGPSRPRAAALTLAAVGFTAVVLVPFLKYPGNPPGSSDGGSIGQRTGLYLVMLLFSVLVAGLAIALGHSLTARLGTWNAVVTAVAAYLLVAAVGAALLPTVDETPADFPATVLYDFRIAALGVQAVLWAVLGLVFGALVERGARRDQAVTALRE